MPRCISECSGIRVFGRRIKSLVFSTDVAIIKNINADAVIAVYPFTPQPTITEAIIEASEVPVFAGVGGGMTNGRRSASIAAYAEHQGAFGVVCNAFIQNEAIRAIKETVEIPIVFTVVSEHADIQSRLDAGVDFLNVSGAARTPGDRRRDPQAVSARTDHRDGGRRTRASARPSPPGANAITYTPPDERRALRRIDGRSTAAATTCRRRKTDMPWCCPKEHSSLGQLFYILRYARHFSFASRATRSSSTVTRRPWRTVTFPCTTV